MDILPFILSMYNLKQKQIAQACLTSEWSEKAINDIATNERVSNLCCLIVLSFWRLLIVSVTAEPLNQHVQGNFGL